MSRGNKKGLNTGHTLPPDPQWIEFKRSDGSPERWPQTTDPNPDSTGDVNFYREYESDESGSVYWRCQIAMELAKQLNYPVGPKYVLKSWPDKYKMFDHNKGPQANPRHDPYLIGSKHVNRFRSASEFIPHALWLLTDETMDRRNCACKYCAKLPQKIVSDNFGLSQRMRATPGAPSSQGSRPPREPTKVYTAVRRAPQPVTEPKMASWKGPQHFMIPEREKDLRAAVMSKGKKHKRLYREGEVVWCGLDVPISTHDGCPEDERILFWPGLVEDIRLKTEIHRQPTPSGDVEMVDGTLPVTSRVNGDSSTSDASDAATPWTTVHISVYKIKLLAVDFECFLTDDLILPYQAYSPSPNLIAAISGVKIEVDDDNAEIDMVENETRSRKEIFMERFSKFQPLLSDSGNSEVENQNDNGQSKRFSDAAGPFAMSIQIASRIANYWTPTDEWELSMTFPSTSPPPSSNAGTASGMTPPAPIPNRRAHADPVWNEMRFQGLWWGAERIWMDELVRLKPGRHQFAPDGTDKIKKPAPPSPSALQFRAEQAAVNGEEGGAGDINGAAGRGIFMKIEGLSVVDVPRPERGGVAKECRVSGMIYELADDDWVEPDESVTTTRLTNGYASLKGKEREIQPSTNGTANMELQAEAGQASTTPSLLTSPPSVAVSRAAGPSLIPQPSQTLHPPSAALSSTNITSTFPSTQLLAAHSQETGQPRLQTMSHPTPPITPSRPVILASPLHASSIFPLPDAPTGFKFRPILLPGFEAVIDLTLISGRYYPGILSHPLLLPQVKAGLEKPNLSEGSPLWALEGLVSGVFNSVDPTKWKPSRLAMVKEADAVARSELYEFWKRANGPRVSQIQVTTATQEVNVVP